MNYRKRSSHYLFTLIRLHASEIFFKDLCKLNRDLGKGQLFRMGRLRDRSNMTDKEARQRGHVPLTICDRWDVYVRVPFDGYMFNTDALHSNRARKLIRAAHDLIRDDQQLIEYCNEVHKDLFDKIFHPNRYLAIPATNQNKVIAHKIMKPTHTPYYISNYTNWKVTLTAKVRCVGKGVVADVDRFFENVPGLSDAVLTDANPIDEHKDLPLVTFKYPSKEYAYLSEVRSIRVTALNDTYLEGFDGQQFKKFLKSKIIGDQVSLVELAGKQD